jgi:polyferredoxin
MASAPKASLSDCKPAVAAKRCSKDAVVATVRPPASKRDNAALRGLRIHPHSVTGWFASWRVALVVLTQLVFYGVPWLQWEGRQAVLFDLAARRFYLGPLVLYPQDFIYLTGLLITCALALFVFTAVAGRLWCGYACPQTVYTEIFLWIERAIEGDGPSAASPRRRALVAHASCSSAVPSTSPGCRWRCGPASPSSASSCRSARWRPPSPSLDFGAEAVAILFYGFFTYFNAGWLREKICKFMCPYARFQSVMFDADTLIVTYDAARGEPRGTPPQGQATTPASASCVDCGFCVLGLPHRHRHPQGPAVSTASPAAPASTPATR